MRASIIRLNHAGWGVPKLAQHFGRDPQTIHDDLNRFEQSGVEKLADGKAPEAKPRITPDIEHFMQVELAERRVWNCSMLGGAIQVAFGLKLGREGIWVKLLELGYSWKGTRYVPGKQASPKVFTDRRASLRTLEKRRGTKS